MFSCMGTGCLSFYLASHIFQINYLNINFKGLWLNIGILRHFFFGKVLQFRSNMAPTLFTEDMDFVIFVYIYNLPLGHPFCCIRICLCLFSEQVEEGQSKRFTEKNVDAKIWRSVYHLTVKWISLELRSYKNPPTTHSW